MPGGEGLASDVGHLLFGAALALAFALPTRRGAAAIRNMARAQSASVATAAAWQAWASGSAALAALALVILAAGVGVLPWLLPPADDDEAPVSIRPTALPVTAAAALVLLATLVVLPVHLPGVTPLRENLAFAVAAVLVALFVLATGRGPPRVAGLWALANGVALAGVIVGSPAAAAGVAGLFGLVAIGAAVRPATVP